MNLNYFMSILDLYLNKETEYKTNLGIVKHSNNKVKVNFTMNNNKLDTTNFFMEYDVFMDPTNLKELFRNYKKDLIIIDEKYEYDKLHETCYYCIMLANSRILSFKNFSLEEINNIRNLIYDIKYNPNEIKVIMEDEEKPGYYNGTFRLGQTGFAGFLTLFLVVVWFLNVLIISLWIFKNFL